jgi:energy-coupling factor transporter ATP-binding protein EcfA2
MLQIRNLKVSYRGAILALRSVSFDVPVAPVVAMLGANGAGPATLLRMVSGTLRAIGRGAGGGHRATHAQLLSELSPYERPGDAFRRRRRVRERRSDPSALLARRRRRRSQARGPRMVRRRQPGRLGRAGRRGRALVPPRAPVTVLRNYSCPISMDHRIGAAPSAWPACRCAVPPPPQSSLPPGALPIRPSRRERPKRSPASGYRTWRHRQGRPVKFRRPPNRRLRWRRQGH